MKTIEVKGLTGLLGIILLGLLVLSAVILVPTVFVLVLWNAVVGEIMHGPMIGLGQAALLLLAILMAFKLFFNPQLSLQIKRVKSPDDLEPRA